MKVSCWSRCDLWMCLCVSQRQMLTFWDSMLYLFMKEHCMLGCLHHISIGWGSQGIHTKENLSLFITHITCFTQKKTTSNKQKSELKPPPVVLKGIRAIHSINKTTSQWYHNIYTYSKPFPHPQLKQRICSILPYTLTSPVKHIRLDTQALI